jgi:hypothetical protein
MRPTVLTMKAKADRSPKLISWALDHIWPWPWSREFNDWSTIKEMIEKKWGFLRERKALKMITHKRTHTHANKKHASKISCKNLNICKIIKIKLTRKLRICLFVYCFTSCTRIFLLIWIRHHWRVAKVRPLLCAQGLWAGRDLYRATLAVTRDLGFSGLIRTTAPISRSPFTTNKGMWRVYSNLDRHESHCI